MPQPRPRTARARRTPIEAAPCHEHTRRAGATHGGILRTEAPDEVVLGTVAGPDVRIPRPDIAEIEPGTVSLMPPGYGELLSRQELADLLAFLKAAR